MSFNDVSLEQIRARVVKTSAHGIQLNMSTDESKKLLKRHVNRKTNLVIMIIDVNNSTEMSLTLQEDRFALLIQTFAQEISIAVRGYGGYVFKYEGDAVIAVFPEEYDKLKACNNALNSATSILQIIREIINPAFKENGLPEISVKIGLTYGYALVLLYGGSLEKAHIDLIGSSISLAPKIVSITRPNQVLIGESIYNIVKLPTYMNNSRFVEIILDPIKWKYLSRSDPDSMYRVYKYAENYSEKKSDSVKGN